MDNNSLNARYTQAVNLSESLAIDKNEQIISFLMELLDSGLFNEIKQDKKWEQLIFSLIEISNFNVKNCLIIAAKKIRKVCYSEIALVKYPKITHIQKSFRVSGKSQSILAKSEMLIRHEMSLRLPF